MRCGPYMYIYIEVKTVQYLPFFVLKIGPSFCFLFVFCFWISRSPCRKKRLFKNNANIKQKWPNSCVKNWSNFVAQHTWTSFSTTLDQVLTQDFCFFVFWGVETPIFVVFSANNANFKEMQKNKKKTLFVSTPVLTALVKMFFLRFSFLRDISWLVAKNFQK